MQEDAKLNLETASVNCHLDGSCVISKVEHSVLVNVYACDFVMIKFTNSTVVLHFNLSCSY